MKENMSFFILLILKATIKNPPLFFFPIKLDFRCSKNEYISLCIYWFVIIYFLTSGSLDCEKQYILYFWVSDQPPKPLFSRFWSCLSSFEMFTPCSLRNWLFKWKTGMSNLYLSYLAEFSGSMMSTSCK